MKNKNSIFVSKNGIKYKTSKWFENIYIYILDFIICIIFSALVGILLIAGPEFAGFNDNNRLKPFKDTFTFLGKSNLYTPELESALIDAYRRDRPINIAKDLKDNKKRLEVIITIDLFPNKLDKIGHL
jgi:hypothetical protein